MKKWALILCLVVILGWLAWPYYAVFRFGTALRDADTARLESRVDWESVRQGLREDLNSLLQRTMKDKAVNSNEAFGAGLATFLGPAIINSIINSYVTPQGIAAIIRTGQLPKPDAMRRDTGPSTASNHGAHTVSFDNLEYAFFSGGPFTFLVTFKLAASADNFKSETVSLRFKWNGNWRLARVLLPITEK